MLSGPRAVAARQRGARSTAGQAKALGYKLVFFPSRTGPLRSSSAGRWPRSGRAVASGERLVRKGARVGRTASRLGVPECGSQAMPAGRCPVKRASGTARIERSRALCLCDHVRVCRLRIDSPLFIKIGL